MTDFRDMTETPYLQEILEYLPMDLTNEIDIAVYIQNITNLVTVNYQYEQYQFSYFGIHLLYMTYIYCSIWKISQINPDRYDDAITFVRPYNGREKDLKMDTVSSVFHYSLVPEKEIGKLFKIINLDKSQIAKIASIVSFRDNMAHASGKLEILTEDVWDTKIGEIVASMRNIHRSMERQIRKWFSQLLLNFCEGKFQVNYSAEDAVDFIVEQMIQNFKLSIKELLVCNEMSIREIVAEHTDDAEKLQNFKKILNDYCEDMGYL